MTSACFEAYSREKKIGALLARSRININRCCYQNARVIPSLNIGSSLIILVHLFALKDATCRRKDKPENAMADTSGRAGLERDGLQ